MLDSAIADGQPVVTEGWVEQATRPQVRFGESENDYGYQWWAYGDGSYQAIGIFGQTIVINPKRKLVIAIVGNWRSAIGSAALRADRAGFLRAVMAAVDAENTAQSN
jgi:CubicO group peptidase (beta-lactamase class C family)